MRYENLYSLIELPDERQVWEDKSDIFNGVDASSSSSRLPLLISAPMPVKGANKEHNSMHSPLRYAYDAG